MLPPVSRMGASLSFTGTLPVALMKCRERGAPVSSEALKCPQCGRRFPRSGERTGMWLIFAFFGLLATLLVWAHWAHP